MIGLIIVLFWVFVGIFAPLLTPYTPTYQDYTAQNQPPSTEHPLGTDSLGRDIWSRLIYGARIVLVMLPINENLWIPGGVAIWGVLPGTALGCDARAVGRLPAGMGRRGYDAHSGRHDGLPRHPPIHDHHCRRRVLGRQRRAGHRHCRHTGNCPPRAQLDAGHPYPRLYPGCRTARREFAPYHVCRDTAQRAGPDHGRRHATDRIRHLCHGHPWASWAWACRPPHQTGAAWWPRAARIF